MRNRVPGIIKFDYETDTFSARPQKREYDSSFQKGRIIFDLDSNGQIVGLEIQDASKVFGASKIALHNATKIEVKLEVSEESVDIEIKLEGEYRNTHQIITGSFEKTRPQFLKPSAMELAVT